MQSTHPSPPWLCADAAELRVHFAIEGAHPENKLLFGANELRQGFMPNAVFDFVCCGAYAAPTAGPPRSRRPRGMPSLAGRMRARWCAPGTDGEQTLSEREIA